MRIPDSLRSRTAVLVLSALSAVTGFSLAQSYVTSVGRTVPVVVATEDIPPYYTFQRGDPKLGVVPVPRLAVRRDTATDPATLVGRTTRSVIPAGTPVSAPYLAGEAGGAGGSLARALRDAGRRSAVSWRFSSDDAVAGRIAAGDRVDVVIVTKDKEGAAAVAVVPGVLVLDVVKPDDKVAGPTGSITVVFEEQSPSLLETLASARVSGGSVYLRLLPAEGQARAAVEERGRDQ